MLNKLLTYNIRSERGQTSNEQERDIISGCHIKSVDNILT